MEFFHPTYNWIRGPSFTVRVSNILQDLRTQPPPSSWRPQSHGEAWCENKVSGTQQKCRGANGGNTKGFLREHTKITNRQYGIPSRSSSWYGNRGMIAQEATSRKWGFCLEGCSAPRVVLFVTLCGDSRPELAPMNQQLKHQPAASGDLLWLDWLWKGTDPHVERKAFFSSKAYSISCQKFDIYRLYFADTTGWIHAFNKFASINMFFGEPHKKKGLLGLD